MFGKVFESYNNYGDTSSFTISLNEIIPYLNKMYSCHLLL